MFCQKLFLIIIFTGVTIDLVHAVESNFEKLILLSTNLSIFIACTDLDGLHGECKDFFQCPKVQLKFIETKKKPYICEERFRTICCPYDEQPTAITIITTQSPKSVSEKSKCE